MLKSFARNTDGNVAMMFGVSVVTLLTVMGVAIDYTGASRAQNELQGMVDAATLAAARAKSTKKSDLEEIAAKVVAEHNKSDLNIVLTLDIVDDQVIVLAETRYDTHVMGMMGRPEMTVQARAGSPISALTPVKLALVLDTTASMEGANMTALKSAASAMIDDMKDFEAPVAASLVPFGQYVNIGTHRKGATWLDVSQDGTTETREHCWDERRTISPRSCTPTGRTLTRPVIVDGRQRGTESYPEENCTDSVSELTGNRLCEMRTTTYTWHGCAGSRQAPFNTQAAFGYTHIKGAMNKMCGTELVELTRDLDRVDTQIQTMSTGGSTYMPSGLVWGWRTLQNADPLKTSLSLKMDGAHQTEPAKVMVFMTDGENTKSQGGSELHLHDDSSKAEADALSLELCTAAKADGVQIFTVGYRVDDVRVESRTLLESCASTPSHYFNADNATELKSAFKAIATQLDFARLTM